MQAIRNQINSVTQTLKLAYASADLLPDAALAYIDEMKEQSDTLLDLLVDAKLAPR